MHPGTDPQRVCRFPQAPPKPWLTADPPSDGVDDCHGNSRVTWALWHPGPFWPGEDERGGHSVGSLWRTSWKLGLKAGFWATLCESSRWRSKGRPRFYVLCSTLANQTCKLQRSNRLYLKEMGQRESLNPENCSDPMGAFIVLLLWRLSVLIRSCFWYAGKEGQ